MGKVFCGTGGKDGGLHYLIAGGAVFWLSLDEGFDHEAEIFGELFGKSLDCAFEDFSVEALHVCSLEGGFEGDEFEENAAEGPDVGLEAVCFVSPDFWACVVRSACLSEIQTLVVRQFGHIHIPKLHCPILIHKHIRTLYIPMHDVRFMQSFQPTYKLNENLPNLDFPKHIVIFLVLHNLLIQITSIAVLHNNAQAIELQINKSLLVVDYILTFDTRQNSHFIYRILPFLFAQIIKFHFFQSVIFVSCNFLNVINT